MLSASWEFILGMEGNWEITTGITSSLASLSLEGGVPNMSHLGGELVLHACDSPSAGSTFTYNKIWH